MFPMDVIMRSVKKGSKTTLSCSTGMDAAVRKPISEIFGGFEPSMEVIESTDPSILVSMFFPSNQPAQPNHLPTSVYHDHGNIWYILAESTTWCPHSFTDKHK
jgi:hypothetical protein